MGLKVLVGAIGVAALFQTLSFSTERDVPLAAPSPSYSLPQRETNILLPDLVGLETGPSTAKLEGLGLTPRVEIVEPGGLWSTVVAQDVPPGADLVPGAAATLQVTEAERPPLDLPQMADGECPATSVHPSPRFRQVVGTGRIRLASATEDGSIDLLGNKVKERFFRISTLWTTGRGYTGPAVIRGDRIDDSGSVEFEQDVDIEPFGPSLVGEPSEMHFARGGAPGGFAWSAAITLQGGPGCYAFQIDGPDFTEHIVVRATR